MESHSRPVFNLNRLYLGTKENIQADISQFERLDSPWTNNNKDLAFISEDKILVGSNDDELYQCSDVEGYDVEAVTALPAHYSDRKSKIKWYLVPKTVIEKVKKNSGQETTDAKNKKFYHFLKLDYLYDSSSKTSIDIQYDLTRDYKQLYARFSEDHGKYCSSKDDVDRIFDLLEIDRFMINSISSATYLYQYRSNFVRNDNAGKAQDAIQKAAIKFTHDLIKPLIDKGNKKDITNQLGEIKKEYLDQLKNFVVLRKNLYAAFLNSYGFEENYFFRKREKNRSRNRSGRKLFDR